MLLIGREREKLTNRENPRTIPEQIGKIPEKSGSPKKQKRKDKSRSGSPPRLKHPRLAALDKILVTRLSGLLNAHAKSQPSSLSGLHSANAKRRILLNATYAWGLNPGPAWARRKPLLIARNICNAFFKRWCLTTQGPKLQLLLGPPP